MALDHESNFNQHDKIDRNSVVGGVKVEDAIVQVEEELARWKCDNYTHITRAMGVTANSTIDLETIFSKPVQEQPVPVAVVCVYFHYEIGSGALTYQFEQECVQHTVGGQSLAPGKYEHWLDRIIGNKLQVRQLHDLATPFEESRLVPPPVVSTEDIADEKSEVDSDYSLARDELKRKASIESMDQGLSMDTLLENIFDAADEESEFELTHKEVADLLYATPLGLADWDIKLLLTTATELETGRIEYRPFVQAAPQLIEALLKRRGEYDLRQQSQPGNTTVQPEAIELCYGEEIEEVARAAREAFSSFDAGGKGTLSRHEFRRSLIQKGERFSMQEVQMLMQMCKEDEYGQVPYDDVVELLQKLRIDALHNALVETNVQQLRTHLILLCRREGMTTEPIMSIWELRGVMLSADQLCLSRMQIHVILSILHPDEHGDVDVEYFLRVCCTVIPQMFDIATFNEKAAMIAKEKADTLAKQEMEELQGITSSLSAKRRVDDEDQEDVQANAPDRDAVEKALIHIGNQADDKHRSNPALEMRKFLEAMRSEHMQQCQLTDHELRGFIAEAESDDRNEVHFAEHIKTWVPIIFELRKSRVYDGILSKDWGLSADQLVDLSMYDGFFPIIATGDEDVRRPSSTASRKRRPSSGKRPGSGRRPGSSHRRGDATPERQISRTSGRRPSRGRPSRSNSKRNLKRGSSNESASSRASSYFGGSQAPSRTTSRAA